MYKDLGLLIVDEEQKFGVNVKDKLKTLRATVDTLTLTATPIPRTLQFSLLGARDLSIISTPPPNRYPVQTVLQPFNEHAIKEAIEYELSRGGQVYFVHDKVKNIGHIADMVRKLCPGARVAVGHGQLEGHQLEAVMLDFIEGNTDVLVATTIVENRLDIPNANTIIINEAQNFGLSDLHQLRGRVGRSNRKAFCYLLCPSMHLLAPDAPPPAGHRTVQRPGQRHPHRHEGPRHPRCRRHAGRGTERLHQRHRHGDLPPHPGRPCRN